ncbi:MAG: hypothetical protein RJA99_3864 [Pseudomonadota bacterium]
MDRSAGLTRFDRTDGDIHFADLSVCPFHAGRVRDRTTEQAGLLDVDDATGSFDAADTAKVADTADVVGATDATGITVDPSTLSLPALEARITELAGHLNAAEHRFLVLLAEFDRREGWADGATRSCAHWLGWKCGLDLGAARERVRVARALESLPGISAALLEREARQQANRGLSWHWDDDGTLHLRACLPADEGALVLKALQCALDDEDREARAATAEAGVFAETSPDTGDGSGVAAETSPGSTNTPCASAETASCSTMASCASAETRSASTIGAGVSAETSPSGTRTVAAEPARSVAQRRADALVRFAESWLAHGDGERSGGERHQIVVHVDVRTLTAGAAGRSELDGDGPVLAAETVRRLGCDAGVVAIVEDAEGTVLETDLTHRPTRLLHAIGPAGTVPDAAVASRAARRARRAA